MTTYNIAYTETAEVNCILLHTDYIKIKDFKLCTVNIKVMIHRYVHCNRKKLYYFICYRFCFQMIVDEDTNTMSSCTSYQDTRDLHDSEYGVPEQTAPPTITVSTYFRGKLVNTIPQVGLIILSFFFMIIMP